MACHVEGFRPIGRRYVCMKKKGSNDIIYRPNHAFRSTVFLGRSWARKTKLDVILVK